MSYLSIPTSFAFTPRKASTQATLPPGAFSSPDCFWSSVSRLSLILSESRAWFNRERAKPIHPLISTILTDDKLLPYVEDWRALTLECPHVSSDGRLAYTRSDEHGHADRQTVTSPGKYIKRHCPTMPDHVLRDLLDRFTPDTFVITTDQAVMLDAIMRGPRSCMDGRHFSDPDTHPYNVYAPSLGWGMAIRKTQSGEITGRCLVLHQDNGCACFVRSYRMSEEGYSQADHGLEDYLKSRGYEKLGGWPRGTRLSRIDASDGYLMPYVDGNNSNADLEGDYFVIRADGYFDIQNTTGTTGESCTCPNCGNSLDSEDDYRFVGYHCDSDPFCDECIGNRHTYVIGREGCEYYVRDDNAIYVNSDYYDIDYLTDNDIIYCEYSEEHYHIDDCTELYDGTYCHSNDAVLLADDEYAHCDDSDIVVLDLPAENGADYALESQTWEDDQGRVFHDGTTQEMVDAHFNEMTV